jgi:hypothetical protein
MLIVVATYLQTPSITIGPTKAQSESLKLYVALPELDGFCHSSVAYNNTKFHETDGEVLEWRFSEPGS